MKISLNAIGKRYNKQWIFQNLSYTFNKGEAYAILGNNGSGKSTLLQCIAGAIQLSSGSIYYEKEQQKISPEKAYRNLSFAAPYLELIEEMTLLEQFTFHQKFKPYYQNITINNIIETIGLQDTIHKQIGNFSSGMKQRVKLGLAFFSNSDILCLDEPTSNLDTEGISLYYHLLSEYLYNRIVIIGSNDINEYKFCKQQILLQEYK